MRPILPAFLLFLCPSALAQDAVVKPQEWQDPITVKLKPLPEPAYTLPGTDVDIMLQRPAGDRDRATLTPSIGPAPGVQLNLPIEIFGGAVE